MTARRLAASSSTVSVLICTRDNARRLRRTLESLRVQHTPADTLVEVLVVDNGSTDSTPQVVESLRASWPALRYVREDRPGKGYAYNRGLSELTGDYVMFTDDDVRFPTDWVVRMRDAIHDNDWDVLAGGLSFCPRYAALLQRHGLWSIRSWFAATETEDTGELGVIVGANMMISKAAIDAAGPFKTCLGPGAIGFGDETEYVQRLRQLGFRVGTAYTIQVDHRFALSRLRWPSLKQIAEKRGASGGYLAWHAWGESLNPPSMLEWLTYDLPRLAILPVVQVVWPGAKARRLALRRRHAAIECNQKERRIGPPKWPVHEAKRRTTLSGQAPDETRSSVETAAAVSRPS